MSPADQAERDRFIREHGTNFSVVASAGSGKTRAITDRIREMARRADAMDLLPRLVVVTYTNRAADEMQQRARQALLDAHLPMEVLAAFGRAFFGTIHSFCGLLLRSHGHWLGLPATMENVPADDSGMWRDFVQTRTLSTPGLPEDARAKLLRLIPASILIELARVCPAGTDAPDPGHFPPLDFSEVHALQIKGSGAGNVAKSQEKLAEWQRHWDEGSEFNPFPPMVGSSQKLSGVWNRAKAPLDRWLRAACLRCGTELAREFRQHRVNRGVVTFDDQVSLARDLCRHPEAGRRMRECGYRMILDEAQDTDPGQFDVLIELARPPGAKQSWLEEGGDPPRPGHFSMVGDFQQSIYHQRADLDHYRRIHETLACSTGGAALEFSVTFRLDGSAIDFVNDAFPHVLTGQGGQVNFIPLQSRPDVLPGQVLRIEMPSPPEGSIARPESLAAAHLAAWLKTQNLGTLRASSWSQVAILCPRKAWFRPIRTALANAGFSVEIHSADQVQGESPAYAWFTALITIFAEPRNGFEVAGVLRELFGLSDHDLAEFCERHGGRLQIESPTSHHGPAADVLCRLQKTHALLAELSLFDQVETIVRDTELRLRLRCLPDAARDGLEGELDRLLVHAAAEESRGTTLVDFARKLCREASESRPLPPHCADAIQLLTCHKAKGSEWQAVILPSLSRKIISRSPSYPMFLRAGENGAPTVIPTSQQKPADAADDATSSGLLESGRLLYVAITRARHTLVLMDDGAATRQGVGNRGTSSLEILCAEGQGVNGERFRNLPALPQPCSATAAAHSAAASSQASGDAYSLTPWSPGTWQTARTRSIGIVSRTPSGMAEVVEDRLQTNPPLPALAGTGALHGAWWHGFIERLDWRSSAADWDRHFAAAKDFAPDPSRATREWQILGRFLESAPAKQSILRPGLIHHPEMPFLWRLNHAECIEGIVDLAVFDPGDGSWLILDWKTNSITSEQFPDLLDRYAPQLAAYAAAFQAMLGGTVRAALYSTALGKWHTYRADTLDATWRRISRDAQALGAALGREEEIESPSRNFEGQATNP
jgi:ATP-dependent helicase/nuclease subunit A